MMHLIITVSHHLAGMDGLELYIFPVHQSPCGPIAEAEFVRCKGFRHFLSIECQTVRHNDEGHIINLYCTIVSPV